MSQSGRSGPRAGEEALSFAHHRELPASSLVSASSGGEAPGWGDCLGCPEPRMGGGPDHGVHICTSGFHELPNVMGVICAWFLGFCLFFVLFCFPGERAIPWAFMPPSHLTRSQRLWCRTRHALWKCGFVLRWFAGFCCRQCAFSPLGKPRPEGAGFGLFVSIAGLCGHRLFCPRLRLSSLAHFALPSPP